MYSSPCILDVFSLTLFNILYFVGRTFHHSLVSFSLVNIFFVSDKKNEIVSPSRMGNL